MMSALAIVLIDADGSSAFTTSAANFGAFVDFVRRRHYLYVIVVSRRAER